MVSVSFDQEGTQSMVSAIITTYKREPPMVLRALDSVLLQTYREMEVIVVDDSPSDYPKRNEVREAVLARQKKSPEVSIRYIAHDRNMGACIARNTGLQAAQGEYIAYLDDDDEWFPEKIEKQVEVIEQSNAALVYCGYMKKNDKTGEIWEKKTEYLRGNAFKKLLFSNFIGSTSFPLISKQCLNNVGGFDPFMQSAQDYDVWLRLSELYAIDYVHEPLVIYHEHEGETITGNPEKKIKGFERINQKFTQYLNADRKLWWERHICITSFYALNGDLKSSLVLWFRCVCKCPNMIKNNIKYLLIILHGWIIYYGS